MKENVTQIFQDTFEVTGTTDAVSIYGRAKETALQANKAAKALKLDLERAYVGNAADHGEARGQHDRPRDGGRAGADRVGNRVITGGTSDCPDRGEPALGPHLSTRPVASRPSSWSPRMTA
jgi:hypothetical protein